MFIWITFVRKPNAPVAYGGPVDGNYMIQMPYAVVELPIVFDTEIYHRFGFKHSLEDFHEVKAPAVAERIDAAIKELGTQIYRNDLWAPTPGNAGYALELIQTLCLWPGHRNSQVSVEIMKSSADVEITPLYIRSIFPSVPHSSC